MSRTATPDLATVIRAAISGQLKGARVALPARVETYDANTQQVTAQPLVYDGYLDETGKRQSERLPVIAGVPVLFPGGGGFRVTFPIVAGDTVLLVFASSSLEKWLSLGGEVDPVDDRRHHISDGIAIPGLHDFAHPLASAPTSTMSMGKDGGPTIEISGSTIQAGGSSALMLVSDFMSHVHVAPSGGGPTAVPSVTVTGTAVLKGG